MDIRTNTNSRNIFSQGVLVQLAISIWGGKMKIPQHFIEGANPEFVRASKYLVSRDCLKPIEQVRNLARKKVENRSLPFPVTGILFVPKDLIETIDDDLKRIQTQFDIQVEEFIVQYKTFVSQARAGLGELYNAADYPQDIRSKFGFTWRFFVMDTPGNNNLLSPELYAREKQKFTDTMEEFRDAAVAALRKKFSEMVSRMANNLGNNRKFKDSSVNGLKEFMDDFATLNISDDVELAEQVERCKKILGGNVTPDALRDNEFLRGSVAKSMAEVESVVTSNLVNRPIRRLKVSKAVNH